MTQTPHVLLTSVCRPLGVRYGDAPSVGYELLHEQVTRAQGLFSPRSHHVQFSLEYLAENLEAPTAVLRYPSPKELARGESNRRHADFQSTGTTHRGGSRSLGRPGWLRPR